jgi:hypothetical protein
MNSRMNKRTTKKVEVTLFFSVLVTRCSNLIKEKWTPILLLINFKWLISFNREEKGQFKCLYLSSVKKQKILKICLKVWLKKTTWNL